MRTLVVNALRLSEHRTGQGRHIEYIAQQWSRMKTPFDRIVLMCPEKMRLDRLGEVTPITLESFDGVSPRIIWEQIHLPWKASGAAMLFCPSYTCPLLYKGPMVLANHGIYEVLPDEFTRLARLRATALQRYSTRRAQRVIANSLATKADLMRFFGIPENKIDVIYPAAHEFFFRSHDASEIKKEAVRTLGRRVPYVIFVGKLAKRRNLPNLIEAFARVRKKDNLPHHLLIVGPNTSGVPVAELARLHGIHEAVTYCPYKELEPLALLYAGADLFVLPTVYEGISQTMFEAMASGTPVLTIEHPTLSEGGAQAVLAMPRPSVEDLVTGLSRLLSDSMLRRDYAEKGRAQAKRFSWETVARKTMLILDREGKMSDSSRILSRDAPHRVIVD